MSICWSEAEREEMGAGGNAASITECVELGKLLRDTTGEVEGLCRVCLAGMLLL